MTGRQMLAALAAAALACSSGTSTVALSPVSSVAPAPTAGEVPRGTTITMNTSLAMDSASCLTRAALHLGSDTTGPVVPSHMTFTNGHQTMVLRPDSVLRAMTTYFVYMRDSMMGAAMMPGSGGMMGGVPTMHPMILDQVPAGATRMGAGMGWTFTTGP